MPCDYVRGGDAMKSVTPYNRDTFPTLRHKRLIHKLWDSLKPLQRSKAFHMKPTCLFVFHVWDELDPRQKDIVYNAVRIIIENSIVNEEIRRMIDVMKMSYARNFGGQL